MGTKHRIARRVCCIALVLSVLLPIVSLAERGVQPLRYDETRDIRAFLTISGNVATCYGYVIPNGDQDCSIVVTLWRKVGSGWDDIATWKASATGGAKASVNKTKTVSSGVYKLVSVGNVNGEPSYAESPERTCP